MSNTLEETQRHGAQVTSPNCAMTERQRAEVVRVTRSFVGTPYHHMGRVQVDCATRLAEAYYERGGAAKAGVDLRLCNGSTRFWRVRRRASDHQRR
jgi:hypothetical protein